MTAAVPVTTTAIVDVPSVMDETVKTPRLDRYGRRWQWDRMFRSWVSLLSSGDLWFGTVEQINSVYGPITHAPADSAPAAPHT